MVVEIKNIVKRYKDELAVDNVSLSIKEGEVFGLLGPNGAGKTTTINALMGLTKIDKGEILVFNKDINKFSNEVKKEIGIVPQDIAIYTDLTVYENVIFFAKLYGLRGGLLKERAEEVIEFTGLQDKKKAFARNLSGGMKRRLNIACAIAHHPKLIIMDEPTVGIDPQSRNHILESIKNLNKNGSTIIYTSHYMEEVEELCTNIAIMDKGKIIAQGSSDELKELIAVDHRVSLDLSSVNFTLVDNIKNITGVIDCITEGNKIIVISKTDIKNLSSIIDCVVNTGVDILNINIERPNLEGVFLTLTGRSLRD